MGRRLVIFLLALVLLTFITLITLTNARAAFYNVYGLGSRATAMGGAYVAQANDTSSLFYNPAALTECGKLKAELMVMRSFYDLNVELSGDEWVDDPLPEKVYGWDKSPEEMEAKFQKQLKELTYLYLASAMALWKSYLDEPLISMGFSLNSPLEYAARFLFNKSNDPIFIEYTNVPNRFSMLMGLGFDVAGILDDLADIEIPIGVSLGVGANLFFDGEGDLEMLSASRMAMHMPWDAGVVAGILTKPCKTLCDNEILKSIKVGVSYNQGMELKMTFNMKVEDETIEIWSYDSYSPEKLRFGLGLDPLENLTVGLELTRVMWSGFKPPFWIAEKKPESGMMEMVLGTDVFLPAEYDEFYDKFDNIWVPRIGVEYGLLDDSLKLRGGYFFRPSPAPDQIQVTNFIDCNTHAISLGTGYTISDNISVSIHGQWRILAEREMKKDNRDASITGSGNVWNTGITLSVDL